MGMTPRAGPDGNAFRRIVKLLLATNLIVETRPHWRRRGDMSFLSELNGSMRVHRSAMGCCAVASCIAILTAPPLAQGEDKSALIRDALSAALEQAELVVPARC
jgi:hypothetical protein